MHIEYLRNMGVAASMSISIIVHGKLWGLFACHHAGARLRKGLWARSLPNARLLTVDNAAHMPWREAPEFLFPSIQTFLTGSWRDDAEKVL